MSEQDEDGYELEDAEEEATKLDEPEAHQSEDIQEIEPPDSWQNEIERALESVDRAIENDFRDEGPENEREAPDVWWVEDINKIQNPIVRNKEIVSLFWGP